MDTNKMHGENTKWELHKNAICCFEHILDATSDKTATIWPLASHLKNHLSKRNNMLGTTREAKTKLISDILQWTPTHRCATVGQPTRT